MVMVGVVVVVAAAGREDVRSTRREEAFRRHAISMRYVYAWDLDVFKHLCTYVENSGARTHSRTANITSLAMARKEAQS